MTYAFGGPGVDHLPWMMPAVGISYKYYQSHLSSFTKSHSISLSDAVPNHHASSLYLR